jgi:phosphatidylinositol-3-phosphatase
MDRRIVPVAIERAVLVGHGWRLIAAIALGALLIVVTVVVAVTPARASTIFADGFESGDLSNWTANFGLVAQQQDVFAGTWAARAQGSGTRAYAYDQLPSAIPEVTAGTRFDVLSNSTPVVLLRLQTASGSNLMTLSLTKTGKMLERNDVSGRTTRISAAPAKGVWHHVVVHALIDGTAGHIDVALDDPATPQISNVESLGTTPIGRLQLGDNTINRTFNVAFDEVVADAPADVDPPTQPTGLTAGSISASAVTLTWNPSQDDRAVAGYTVYRSDSGAPAVALGTATTTSFNDRTVSPSTAYSYTVDAFDRAGNHSVVSAPLDVVTPSSGPAPNPVVIIFMENKSASTILGNPATPYLNQFFNGGRAFTNYREGDPVGPSLPDYLQIAAGSSCGSTSDVVTAGDPNIGSACPTTVWNQLSDAGQSWGVYMEGMPTACYAGVTYGDPATDGPYALKHNPATPFPSVYGDPALCASHVLPYSSFDPAALPAVSFISPNICDDQHGSTNTRWTNCLEDSPELLRRGDDWLAARVPAMVAAGATVIITYDESGVLYAAEQGPGVVPGSVDPTPYTHYSILAAIEARYGLPALGGAQTANVLPL